MKTIRELLTGRQPVTCPGTATVLEAIEKMTEAKIGALVVVDKQGPVGIFTERDLMTRVVAARKDPATTIVGKVMTSDMFTAAPEDRINVVARQLQERHVRHVPVLENGALLGILSLRDLLAEHLNEKRHEVQALTAYIQGEGEGPTAD